MDVTTALSLLKNLKIWSYKAHIDGIRQTRLKLGGERRQRLILLPCSEHIF